MSEGTHDGSTRRSTAVSRQFGAISNNKVILFKRGRGPKQSCQPDCNLLESAGGIHLNSFKRAPSRPRIRGSRERSLVEIDLFSRRGGVHRQCLFLSSGILIVPSRATTAPCCPPTPLGAEPELETRRTFCLPSLYPAFPRPVPSFPEYLDSGKSHLSTSHKLSCRISTECAASLFAPAATSSQ